ncbi:2-hydroxyacid dehydrogenase [Actinoallomurus purpureus]|uniref:2-hydroxyacid dehydrogenase n=1 Tax=Actinoallomurus purpureus TaxID=478114 RepID=UPI00209225CB|nr:2-hydroxyacid dehydrogenase [Actinoallomurus purpureus]MCO6007482.1 2-hydroxyacid dehydrogenase [Actinoallomurus purpureus]
MKVWVPDKEMAEAMADVAGAEVDVYPGGDDLPGDPAEVEFYVPPFVPTPQSRAVLARMRSLKVLQLQVAGVDTFLPHVPPGAVLCNGRGVHDASTAEWTVGAIIAAQRDFPRFAGAQRDGRWDWHMTDALADRSVLIVGYGSVGAAIERRLLPFETEVTRVARTARDGVHPVGALPELLPQADIVVLIVPFTEETTGLFDADLLARMKDGALLVNAARGPVVDTGALLAELSRGRLRAVLDVTDPEPLPAGHPLWSAPGVFITPHVGGSTPASRRRAVALVREQLERHVRDEPLRNVITDTY